MIVLDWPTKSGEPTCRRVVLLFGAGLIGSAILSAIEKRAAPRRRELAFTWHREADRASEAAAILSRVRELTGGSGGSRVDVIWSAGRAGFASSQVDLEGEQRAFADVVDLSRGLSAVTDATSFHFVSSAGGLFEGQTNIDQERAPKPLRPYGFAKVEQEERVRELGASMAFAIYRPTSVYGYAGPRSRKGLIASIVQNAIRYQTTRIFGSPDTIRDYVFADDIGRFIADQIIGRRGDAKTVLLASGKPTSMLELTAMVQGILQRQLYLQFDPRPSNALNISVLPSSLPSGWRTTALESGVFATAARIMSNYRIPLG